MDDSVQMTVPVRADPLSIRDGTRHSTRARHGHDGSWRDQFALFLALRCAAKIATQGMPAALEHF